MKYDDAGTDAHLRRSARKRARNMKEMSFDVFGFDDRHTMKSEAASFKREAGNRYLEFTFNQAATLIYEEFVDQYGITPFDYFQFISQEQMNDARPREEIKAEAKNLAPILDQIMGRKE